MDAFTTAWRGEVAVRGEDLLPSVLARACARVTAFDAAGLSLMSGPDARVPLGASDEDASVAERLQYTVGEGPCFRAMTTGRPVVVTEEGFAREWPVLAEQHFSRTPFRGGLSVPLRAGGVPVGVLDLYLLRSRPLDGGDVLDAQDVAAATTAVLVGTLHEPGGDVDRDHPGGDGAALDGWRDSPATHRRRQVWIAAGMADLVLAVPSEQALALLRAHAYATGVTLDAFAEDVVSGRFDVAELRLDLLR